MSNLVPTNVKLPDYIGSRLGATSALSTAVSGGLGGGAEYPRISIKGARFRIKEDGVESVLPGNTLEAIIVGANPGLSKTYYAAKWNPDDEPTKPDCYSMDGIAPAHDAETPQNDICSSCPMNAWGSKISAQTGEKIKACSDQKRLAIVSADDPTGPIYLLQVTPAALTPLRTYQKELAMRGIPLDVVKTMISFDTDASYPKLKFSFSGFMTEAEYADVEPLFGSDAVLAITGEGSVAPAPVAIAKPAAKAVAKPVVTPEPEPEPEPEPVAPQRGFGSKAAAPAAEPAPAKRGFGGTPAAEPAPAKRVAPKKAAQVHEAPSAAGKAPDVVAAEIADLIKNMGSDD